VNATHSWCIGGAIDLPGVQLAPPSIEDEKPTLSWLELAGK
jgi:hypothetical protein